MFHLPAVWHRSAGHELQSGTGGGDQQREKHGEATRHSEGRGRGGGHRIENRGMPDKWARMDASLRTCRG